MALSNIFREPQREITESLVGIAPLALFLWADYEFGVWLAGWVGHGMPWFAGMVIGGMAVAILFSVLLLTHDLGETICGSLQDSGIHLRPRNRK